MVDVNIDNVTHVEHLHGLFDAVDRDVTFDGKSIANLSQTIVMLGDDIPLYPAVPAIRDILNCNHGLLFVVKVTMQYNEVVVPRWMASLIKKMKVREYFTNILMCDPDKQFGSCFKDVMVCQAALIPKDTRSIKYEDLIHIR